jgi:hypothetical protein
MLASETRICQGQRVSIYWVPVCYSQKKKSLCRTDEIVIGLGICIVKGRAKAQG